jgi:hypothetical protein
MEEWPTIRPEHLPKLPQTAFVDPDDAIRAQSVERNRIKKDRALANAKEIADNNAEMCLGLSCVFLATDQARWKVHVTG